MLDSYIAQSDIHFSLIAPVQINEKIGFLIEAAESTSGIQVDSYSGLEKDVLTHIFGDYYVPVEPYYIMSHNLQPVKLDAVITPDYKKAYDDVMENWDSRTKYTNFADTDNDGLYDFEEIDFSEKHFNNGTGSVPSDITISGDSISFLSYTAYAYKYKTGFSEASDLATMQVIPTTSDLLTVDSDSDEISDLSDPDPL
jgi:hypothetical protein